MDYLFFFNANLLIQEKITKEEFLPNENERLVATLHPGFYNKKRSKFTYEDNKISTAYISKNEGLHYFAGGLNGGETKSFLEAIRDMSNNINTDTENGVTAKWHDESHWNRYLVGRKDIKILPPSYLYPEGWTLPFQSIILIRDKNKYGGHSALRNVGLDKKNKYILRFKKIFAKMHKIIKKLFSSRKSTWFNMEQIKKEKNIIFITIAFNNFEIIKTQNYYLNKNIKDDFNYLIADNSTDQEISLHINQYCNLNKIPYVKLPKNIAESNPSKSHGKAINWVYNKIIKKIKPTHFGFLDHDIFPFTETQIIKLIDKDGLYGLIQERDSRWYLWQGFCFYKFNTIHKYKLNFMPCDGLDTGGSNYYSLYKNINKNELSKIEHIYFDIENKTEIKKITDIDKTIEIIGDWIHLMRTSNWNNSFNKKTSKIEEIIETIQKYFNK